MKIAATALADPAQETPGGFRCRRCGGLMLPEQLCDYALGSGPMECWGWRCVACGELVDPLILQHRRGTAAARQQAEYQFEAE